MNEIGKALAGARGGHKYPRFISAVVWAAALAAILAPGATRARCQAKQTQPAQSITPARPPAAAASRPLSGTFEGDFFIIASIDPTKKELLLKLPTEVTQVIRIDSGTRYAAKDGKALHLSDLRAGDTVYITLTHADPPVALMIRKGPMTQDELNRRYLKSPSQ